MKTDSFSKMFPIYSIENDLIISKNGDISVAFKLMLPKVYSLNIDDINKINGLFDNIIRSLPENTIIQKQDYFFVATNKEKQDEDEEDRLDNDASFFYEKPLLHQECYLFITKDSKDKLSLSSTQKCYDLYSLEVKAFFDKVSLAMSFLETSGFFTVKRLNDENIIKIIGKYYSLSTEGNPIVGDLFFDKRLSVRNNTGEMYAICSSNQLPFMFNASKEKGARSYTNFLVPFIQPICLGLECNHIYNQVIYIDKTEDVFSGLKKLKSSPIQSKDYEITFNTEIDELVNIVTDNDLKLIKQHYSITLWDNKLEKLQKEKHQLESYFKQLGIISYQIKHGLKELYVYNAPGAAMYIPEHYRFYGLSNQVPVFLNIESYYNGNKDGILFKDREKDIPVRLDLWDAPIERGLTENRNRLVFGFIEKGETFLINHIVSQYFEQGHQICMVDINDSYKEICNELAGQYHIYSLKPTLKFNPFYVTNPEEVSAHKIDFLTLLILLIWKEETTTLLNNNKFIIESYINEFYKYICFNTGITPSIFSFYEFVDQNNIKQPINSTFNKESLLAALKCFFNGKYKEVFTSSQPVNSIQERFVVFDLSNIKNDPILLPLISMLCINVITDKTREITEIKNSIFINECWKPICTGEIAQFIKTLYKTVNSLDNELVLITKDVETVLESSMGDFIINHTDTMIMLSPKNKMAIKNKLAMHLSFTKSDLEKLCSTNKREVFIKVGYMSNIYVVDEILCRLPRFKTPINLINNYY